MALANKVYTRVYGPDGSDSDALSAADKAEYKRRFDENEYLDNESYREAFGVILYAIQSLSEDIDEIRRYADPVNGSASDDLGKIMSNISFDASNNITLTNTTIPYSQIQDVSATDRILGRDSTGAGVIEEISPASLRTMINVADGANAYVHPDHTGDVTSSADGATTIGNDKVTYAKMQNLAANNRILGRVAAGSGDCEELTALQVRTMINVAYGATADQTNVTGSSGSCTGNAATATALASGNQTINGDLTVTAGTSGDATLIIDADTDNNNENDHPQLWFRQDGGKTAGAIQMTHNKLQIISNESAHAGISFLTGETNNTGTTNPSSGATEKMAISPAGVVSTTGDMTVGGALTVTGGISVANGGTGASSFTSGQVLYGNGTGAIQDTANITTDGSWITAQVGGLQGKIGLEANYVTSPSKSQGTIVAFGSTTSMVAGGIYYLDGLGGWQLANADTPADATGMMGLALGASSNVHGILLNGIGMTAAESRTRGDVLYLSTTDGRLNSTAPSSSGDIVRVMGYALDSTSGLVYFNPSGTWVEIT